MADMEYKDGALCLDKINIDGYKQETINDIDQRIQLLLDSSNKIISYRDYSGKLYEQSGIKSNEIDTEEVSSNTCNIKDKLNLSVDALIEFGNDLHDSGIIGNSIKKFNLPDNGTVNIFSETFYLTSNEGYSDKTGIVLIQDLEDTDLNARAAVPLSNFYVKSSLIDNGDGTYSKYNDGVEGHDVKLTFYPAGLVTKIGNIFYVISTLDENYNVTENSIEVTQITDTPSYKAWPVNKKNEHYCLCEIDFGNYLNNSVPDASSIIIGVKFQGSSTLYNRKRNFRFTFYKNKAKPYYPIKDGEIDDKFAKKNKIKIGEMARLSGYNLKANWSDSSRIKEYLMNCVFHAIWESRNIYDQYPWNKEHTPYTGATGMIKGFPISVSVGGEFYGLDIFGLKKDGNNYIIYEEEDGILEGGVLNTSDCWTNAQPVDWEDEINDEEDWVIDNQTQSNYDALIEFFAFINNRLYNGSDGSTYLNKSLTYFVGNQSYSYNLVKVNSDFKLVLIEDESVKITGVYTTDSTIRYHQATRTEYTAYRGSDGNLYMISELTDIDGVLYVTSTLEDPEPVTATIVDGHNIYTAEVDGTIMRFLSSELTKIDNEYYYIDYAVNENSISAELIPFDKKHMAERLDILSWIDYFICLQVFLMRDSTCRNLMLYSGPDKKKFYPFFYDLDLSWIFGAGDYDRDIMTNAYASDVSLWTNIKNEYWDEIINRYNELRQSVINVSYITKVYNDIKDRIPVSWYTAENTKWGTNAHIENFKTNINNIELRLNWLDSEYYK